MIFFVCILLIVFFSIMQSTFNLNFWTIHHFLHSDRTSDPTEQSENPQIKIEVNAWKF